MASEKAVLTALTILGRAFAGEVSPERVDLYHAALDDVTDAELALVTAALVKSHAGEFIPTPATIRAAVPRLQAPTLDVDRIIRELDRMGSYSPGGWCPPSVEKVRRLAGTPIADAFADVGPSRLLAEDPKSRDIAAQEFRRALKATAPAGYAAFPPWAVANPPRLAAQERPRLIAGEED